MRCQDRLLIREIMMHNEIISGFGINDIKDEQVEKIISPKCKVTQAGINLCPSVQTKTQYSSIVWSPQIDQKNLYTVYIHCS